MPNLRAHPRNRTALRVGATTLAATAVVITVAACSGSTSASTTTASSASGAAGTSAGATAPASPVAQIPNLTGNTTSVKLSSAFTTALATLKLTPGVTGTAKLENGSLVFPITGGSVKYYKPGTRNPYVTGSIIHNGSGITLTGGATTVGLSNFIIDPGGSRLYGDVTANGQPVASQAYLFNIDGSTLQPLQAGPGTATLTGARVLISPVAAALLNKTFNTTAVTDTLEVGIATIQLKTS